MPRSFQLKVSLGDHISVKEQESELGFNHVLTSKGPYSQGACSTGLSGVSLYDFQIVSVLLCPYLIFFGVYGCLYLLIS